MREDDYGNGVIEKQSMEIKGWAIVPRCGARTRRGTPCRAQGRGRGGRCHLHGGASTGPRTAAGLYRISEAQRLRWERWRAAKATG
jgi:hypothetical protein